MAQLIYQADDEKNIRELIALFLQQEGYQVQKFSDGDSLAAACRETLPDLVILDIMMPGTDGLVICSQLRKKNPDLPIIIVSAKDSPMDRESIQRIFHTFLSAATRARAETLGSAWQS